MKAQWGYNHLTQEFEFSGSYKLSELEDLEFDDLEKQILKYDIRFASELFMAMEVLFRAYEKKKALETLPKCFQCGTTTSTTVFGAPCCVKCFDTVEKKDLAMSALEYRKNNK